MTFPPPPFKSFVSLAPAPHGRSSEELEGLSHPPLSPLPSPPGGLWGAGAGARALPLPGVCAARAERRWLLQGPGFALLFSLPCRQPGEWGGSWGSHAVYLCKTCRQRAQVFI